MPLPSTSGGLAGPELGSFQATVFIREQGLCVVLEGPGLGSPLLIAVHLPPEPRQRLLARQGLLVPDEPVAAQNPLRDPAFKAHGPSEVHDFEGRMENMEVLGSRILLHPSDPKRSHRFYRDTLGLAIYREFGSREAPGLVFFLGNGFSRSVDGRLIRRAPPW